MRSVQPSSQSSQPDYLRIRSSNACALAPTRTRPQTCPGLGYRVATYTRQQAVPRDVASTTLEQQQQQQWREDSSLTAQQTRRAFTCRQATSVAELRAAAYLRAASFYTYPPERSQYAARSHRRMKADTEWETLQEKIAGKDKAYAKVKVTCHIATTENAFQDSELQQAKAVMDLSSQLPAVDGKPPQLVLGTLDINQGINLPAEELAGTLPLVGAESSRAYLSNVCVADGMRRQGVAQQLLSHAQAVSQAQGITHLYVHVVCDNVAAIQLYCQGLGFAKESEESDIFARGLSRPRRLLLAKYIG